MFQWVDIINYNTERDICLVLPEILSSSLKMYFVLGPSAKMKLSFFIMQSFQHSWRKVCMHVYLAYACLVAFFSCLEIAMQEVL